MVMDDHGHTIAQPSKEQVRAYMEHRRAEKKMPPSLEEIRRQLGWDLCEISRQEVGGYVAK